MSEKQILEALKPVAQKLENLKLHENKELYTEWLAQTYYFVVHSVPLLVEAAKTGSTADFRDRCQEHIKEEGGHDKVALNDLKQIGENISSFPEWEWTKNFYGRQYDLVEKRGELLLGYILALEGLAILSVPAALPIIEAYGLKATKFVKIHVEEDQEHLPHAIEQTLAQDCKEEILANFQQTLDEYCCFLDTLEQKSVLAAA